MSKQAAIRLIKKLLREEVDMGRRTKKRFYFSLKHTPIDAMKDAYAKIPPQRYSELICIRHRIFFLHTLLDYVKYGECRYHNGRLGKTKTSPRIEQCAGVGASATNVIFYTRSFAYRVLSDIAAVLDVGVDAFAKDFHYAKGREIN